MVKKLLAFRRQGDAAVGAYEQMTAKLGLEIVHTACNIRLVIVKYFRSFRKTVMLGYMVKNPVIIVSNHEGPPEIS